LPTTASIRRSSELTDAGPPADAHAPRRARWRRVDGVLLLDKPVGLSSNTALQRARRLLHAEKAGHAGTLDPLASGLLPVCLGEATKFAQLLLDARKRYRALIRFGVATSTGDAEGEIVDNATMSFDVPALRAALARFVGRIEQVPPRFAALKRDGRPYYEYARQGIEISREPRVVEIDALTLVEWSPPDAVVDVTCSKGTYVRVLAEDLGRALCGCAHLAGLRRTGAGPFDVRDAITLDALEALDPSARDAQLLPADAALAGVPVLSLDEADAKLLLLGQRPANPAASGRYRAYGPAGFVGLVEADGSRVTATRLVRAPGGDGS